MYVETESSMAFLGIDGSLNNYKSNDFQSKTHLGDLLSVSSKASDML